MVKDIEKPVGIIITSRSRVVVQNFTEIGSLILGGQIGEVLVFLHTNTHTDTQTFFSPRLQLTKYGPNWMN